jgi:transposase
MAHGSKRAMAIVDVERVIGLDLSDKKAQFAELDPDPASEEVLVEGTVPLTEAGLRKRFGERARCRVVLEVGAQSPWVSRLLTALGHDVIVANPRQIALIFRNQRKTDRLDAENLARLARVDRRLLRPIVHRSADTHADLVQIRARDLFVRQRTAAINFVRGELKVEGVRVGRCSAETFARKAWVMLPQALHPALGPAVMEIARLTRRIQRYTRTIERLAAEAYPQTDALRQVKGVGAITSLAYVLTIEDPSRFRRSRAVGAYLGLTPRLDNSGAQAPQLGLSKAGDPHLRRLLVQSAHYILGPFGPDCDLRRWGLRLAGAGSKGRKNRAVAAVARKLAVLLHRLWLSAKPYDPLYQVHLREPEAAA